MIDADSITDRKTHRNGLFLGRGGVKLKKKRGGVQKLPKTYGLHFKSFDLLSLCDFGPHLLEACVFESFDFVYSPVTCFDVRRENWALGVWSSPVMIVWMISRTKVIM